MSIPSDMLKYSRLVLDLRHFLRNTISLEESKRVISERLRNRESNFLNLVQRGVYENPRSPYLELLRLSGCEFGDIESMTNQDGVEAALRRLYESGVYLSWEEFKGKKDIARGNARIRFRQSDLDNPYIPHWYQGQSSGSRSAGTRTTFDLRHRLQLGYYRLLELAANGALDVPLAIWKPVLPSVSGISHVLHFWIVGKPVVKWFSPVDERQVRAPLQHRLALRYIIYGGRLWGARLAKPEFVTLAEADKVARWMAATRQEYGSCSLSTSVSLAVRLCQAASENNLNIEGTHLFVSGEPITRAKRERMEAAGAHVTPRYTISEVGRIGCGCAGAGGTDDVHLLSDSVALIQRRRKVNHTDIEVDAFLFTPLLAAAPKILINVESDDYGVVETRSCGCLLEQLGLNRHLRSIRSFAKLTGHGMTVVGSDFVRILEEVLPSKYGGAPTDYQLIEEEDSQGRTRLRLVVSPSVGEVDESEMVDTVLGELRGSVHAGGLTASIWAQAQTLCVKRAYPIPRSGKIMTLELMKLD